MPALKTEPFDVSAGRFGDPQPIEAQQAEQRVVACTGESGSDEHRADFVAVKAGRVRLVVETAST